MDAEDLMIGDWVKVPRLKKSAGRIYRIDCSNGYENAIVSLAISSLSNVDVFINDIEPIPLTNKILQKNGLEYDPSLPKYTYRYHHFEATILKDEQSFPYVSPYDFNEIRIVVPCAYVHQLQHAMRICGIEKKIYI